MHPRVVANFAPFLLCFRALDGMTVIEMVAAAPRVAVDGQANSSAAGRQGNERPRRVASLFRSSRPRTPVTALLGCRMHPSFRISHSHRLGHESPPEPARACQSLAERSRVQRSASRRLRLGQSAGMMDSRDQRWFQSRRSSPNCSSPRARV